MSAAASVAVDLSELSVAIIDGAPRVIVTATGKEYAAPGAASAAAAAAAGGREKTRLTKESGERVADEAGGASLGGPFTPTEDPAFLAARGAVFDEIAAAQRERLARKARTPIAVTLPDGRVIAGVAWETTPLAIAEGISKGLAASAVVAKVAYSRRVGLEAADGQGMVNTGPEDDEGAAAPTVGGAAAVAAGELWDLTRPLEGDCVLELKKFDDKDGKAVFWHSSAHVLGEGPARGARARGVWRGRHSSSPPPPAGECLECKYGSKLCIGPPTEDGFYYDAYMGAQCVGRGVGRDRLRPRGGRARAARSLTRSAQLPVRVGLPGHQGQGGGRVQGQAALRAPRAHQG